MKFLVHISPSIAMRDGAEVHGNTTVDIPLKSLSKDTREKISPYMKVAGEYSDAVMFNGGAIESSVGEPTAESVLSEIEKFFAELARKEAEKKEESRKTASSILSLLTWEKGAKTLDENPYFPWNQWISKLPDDYQIRWVSETLGMPVDVLFARRDEVLSEMLKRNKENTQKVMERFLGTPDEVFLKEEGRRFDSYIPTDRPIDGLIDGIEHSYRGMPEWVRLMPLFHRVEARIQALHETALTNKNAYEARVEDDKKACSAAIEAWLRSNYPDIEASSSQIPSVLEVGVPYFMTQIVMEKAAEFGLMVSVTQDYRARASGDRPVIFPTELVDFRNRVSESFGKLDLPDSVKIDVLKLQEVRPNLSQFTVELHWGKITAHGSFRLYVNVSHRPKTAVAEDSSSESVTAE